MVIKKTLALAMLIVSVTAIAQTGLQGFDRNYPNTPAGDNPRGFTPQISPVKSTSPPPMSTGAVGASDKTSDPFTDPDPMIDGDSKPSDQSSDAMDAPTTE